MVATLNENSQLEAKVQQLESELQNQVGEREGVGKRRGGEERRGEGRRGEERRGKEEMWRGGEEGREGEVENDLYTCTCLPPAQGPQAGN